uniref:Kinesin family member 17 n=1 Tax=Hucho hucho TaxID=62062 RepID=A0A4W5Q0W8_9TELE
MQTLLQSVPQALWTRSMSSRLQQLEQEVVGGEQARNKELQQRHRQRNTLADQRKKQLIVALAENGEESDNVMLNVSIQEEVHAKSRLLENTQGKLKVAKLEIQDLQAEFELERNDYLATIRRQVGEGQLLQSLLERMAPLVRRDCNYSNLDRLRKEATWDDDSVTWRLPDVLVQKTALPSAVAASAQRLSVCMSSAADTGESFQDDEARYKEMMNRNDSENFASNYFKPKTVNQLLGVEPLKGLAVHSAPQGNGTLHLTSSGPNIGPSLSAESLLPRPFRLESLGITPANGKVKRKKSKT